MTLKVLHLSAAQNWGGGENHLENLCYELGRQKEVSNTIFCVKDAVLHQRLKKNKIPFYTAPLANKLDPRYVFRLAKLCRQEKFDLLHLHDSTALSLAVIADHFYDLPPFILSKKTSFPIRTRKQTLYKYNYPKLKKILCVSEATKKISAQVIQDKKRLEVIYHGTRIDKTNCTPVFSLRESLNLQSQKLIVGNIANHIEAKDLETFVRTAHYLIKVKQNHQFHFVQVGNFSKITKQLQDLVQELGLQEHISFLGFIEEASNLIPQFNISLITSEIEGIPQVIYESFFHNVPVVSTGVGGIPEVIENGRNGFLSSPHSPEALGENILFLVENPELIPTFAEISNEKLFSGFTSDLMARKTQAAYKSVIYD